MADGIPNELSSPLGRGVPLPGGDVFANPRQRATAPGGAPGGLGVQPPARSPPSGGVGDMPSFDGSQRTLMENHQRTVAMFDQTKGALKKLDVIRKSLERLADKQDVVTMDDVIQEAGKLVAHGIDPMALAGILADAPQEGGGEALGGWVAAHAQAAAQGEQQLMQQHDQVRNDMGVSAIHMMMAHHNAQMMNPGTAVAMGRPEDPQGNDLSPGNNGRGQFNGDGKLPLPSPGDSPNQASSPPDMLAIGSRFADNQ